MGDLWQLLVKKVLLSETFEVSFRNNAYTCLTGRENASQLAQIKFLAAQSNVSTQTSVEQYWERVLNIRIIKLKFVELHVIVTGFFLVKIVWNSQHLGTIEVFRNRVLQQTDSIDDFAGIQWELLLLLLLAWAITYFALWNGITEARKARRSSLPFFSCNLSLYTSVRCSPTFWLWFFWFVGWRWKELRLGSITIWSQMSLD